MPSTKSKKNFAVVVFALVFLVTRIPFLGYDEINPDAVNWHFRSEQFIVGLKSGDFLKTYQHYHPGVTLMWTMGVPIEIYRQINPQDRVYNEDNFIVQHQIAKYSLVALQLMLSIILIYALKAIFGLKKALLAVLIFSFEPWFLGNSRVLHMDVLLALFVILALTYGYSYYLSRTVKSASLSGIFAGLSFLTKSVGSLTIPVVLLFTMIALFFNKEKSGDKKGVFKFTSVFGMSCVATIFTLFPALWVNPRFVLSDIYNEGVRVGTRHGHDQVVMEKVVDIAGSNFYPLVLILKTTPLIWLGVVLFVYQMAKNHRLYQKVNKLFLLYLAAFYLIYFLGMSVVSKKMDRYMVPLYPWLGIMASVGIIQTLQKVKAGSAKVVLIFPLILVTVISIFYPLVKLYPYYFTYTNPLVGSAEHANKIIGQKPFGIGIPELKNSLTEKYGKDIPLGFIDRKPMSMIYKNSKLYDIRETGTGKYDLIILGPNEVMPENVLKGKYQFVQDGSMYINGLEFWRIYKKEVDNDK